MSQLRERRRKDYPYKLIYRTRWSDNDQYAHMNNAIYFHLFDSIINAYLIEHCGQNPQSSPLIGLVVSSNCQYFSPLSFPQELDLGLRVVKLGKSSVIYEVGVFAHEREEPSAVGGYTHVFVDREERKSREMGKDLRTGLLNISPSAKL